MLGEPNYTIIIPHKDIPDLLMRCLHSIPRRDDVQIIVVDDNSKDADTYIEKYKELSRPNLELFLTKEGKGAGYARNVGLDHAKGKWVLFADADDFFSPNFDMILDEYVDDVHEILIFDIEAVLSDDVTKKSKRDSNVRYENLITLNPMSLRYSHNVPWAKIILRDLIERNSLRFQEIRWSNDVFFSTQVGILAKKILLVNKILYFITEREGSLMFSKERTIQELETRAKAGIDSYWVAKTQLGHAPTIYFLNWVIELFERNAIVPFIKIIRTLDSYGKYEIYKNIIWGKNKLRRAIIKAIFFLF